MSGHAIQRLVRQSPRKMRLVIDLIRGKDVNEAYAILKFNKKLAARQIAKTLKSAVANAEQKALKDNERFDPDALIVTKAIVNGGQPLKRFTAAAQGRATPIRKRTSHVEIYVDSKESEEWASRRTRSGSGSASFGSRRRGGSPPRTCRRC
jgi:large subunit ribosomal protein L22